MKKEAVLSRGKAGKPVRQSIPHPPQLAERVQGGEQWELRG